MIPFTPGGLGFVEAGLTGTLITAGVISSRASGATITAGAVSMRVCEAFRASRSSPVTRSWRALPSGAADAVPDRVVAMSPDVAATSAPLRAASAAVFDSAVRGVLGVWSARCRPHLTLVLTSGSPNRT
jgi:hypothetical protein